MGWFNPWLVGIWLWLSACFQCYIIWSKQIQLINYRRKQSYIWDHIKILHFGLIWYWRSNFQNNISMSKIFDYFFHWRIQKWRINFYYQHILITLIFNVSTLFSKNTPQYWRSIPNQAKSMEHFYGRFHRPLGITKRTRSSSDLKRRTRMLV